MEDKKDLFFGGLAMFIVGILAGIIGWALHLQGEALIAVIGVIGGFGGTGSILMMVHAFSKNNDF